MSATTSAMTGRRYGLKRVCRTWERSRSALYARRARLQRPARGARPARRGPTPALSDAQLLAAIRTDLARSPFQGEGHRKVHARLRILDDIRVSRTRVLRVIDDAEVATMSATTSAMTGRRYGLKRVCRTWERSRSALYARRARLQRPARGARPARRGPTPALSDAQLLAAIRTDLARSPFQGEGHRKVHARLRILDDIRVSRTRVLRVMRAQGLLSPHRGRQGEMKAHDGTIVTSAPDVMWGTDGVRVFTADDGWVWTFAAVDHWNAECVGWHVCKVGSRFAALEPIAQGLGRLYGSVEADVARGLALRMDHGSQYLSDHFLNQLRYWGIHPSFGFVEEPETNGVVERWNRTLKEQAVYGRVFRNLAEVRAAVAEFVVRYNQCWRLEKLAYRTPLEAREEYLVTG